MMASISVSSVRGGVLGQLLAVAAPWRGVLAVVAILVVVSGLLELVPPLVMRRVVDEHLMIGQTEGLFGLALLYLGAAVGVEVAGALAAYLTAVAAQGGLHALRMRLFEQLQRLPIAYYDRTPLGDAISRCTADVETIDTLFSSGVAKVIGDLVRLVLISAAMVALSPPLALVSALVVPPLAAITRFLQVRIRTAERENRRAVGLLNAHLQETLGGAEVVRAFERQDVFVDRFRQVLRVVLGAFNRATAYSAFYPPATATLAATATALLLWVGTSQALADRGISLGTLTAFVLLFQRFFKPITALGDEWQVAQSALSGAERIFQVLSLPADVQPGSPDGRSSSSAAPFDGPLLARGGAAAELREVVFGYRPERPVLHGISIAVRTGEHLALVGRTGAGKSSVLHLLGGLYAPWSGGVRVADQDPRLLGPELRRRIVGAVPQVVQLFGGSVLENLTLYDPSVARETAERAARLAGADAFIRSLPQGYDTPLSGVGRGSGMELSAGQRQLLALARALVFEPVLLLLDEATAAVDGASEDAFRAALRARADDSGGAVLTVAHRLSTAREADRVVVLEAGRIVEQGPPDELVRRGGRFAALVELEAAGWDWRGSGDELSEGAPRSEGR